jgi:hypothetical protein
LHKLERSQFETAQEFAKIMTFAADETTPWAAFGEQIVLWEGEQLKKLAAEFPENAKQKTSMGDASIVNLGKHYQQKSFHVEFLTADAGLKAQEPLAPVTPTRRSDRII